MATVVGFEPTNRGIKTLCLTAWLHRYKPNLQYVQRVYWMLSLLHAWSLRGASRLRASSMLWRQHSMTVLRINLNTTNNICSQSSDWIFIRFNFRLIYKAPKQLQSREFLRCSCCAVYKDVKRAPVPRRRSAWRSGVFGWRASRNIRYCWILLITSKATVCESSLSVI